MMETVERTSPVMAVYFVTIVLIGTYIIMNLFLVVLLELFTLEVFTDSAVVSIDSEVSSAVEPSFPRRGTHAVPTRTASSSQPYT